MRRQEIRIGLEVHVALLTQSKLFCPCPTRWQGKEPNTNVCPVCLGMPGSKPQLNRKALEYAIKVALALNCKINELCYFSRKSYFYPDLAKNFQISQYDAPLAEDGWIELDGKRIRIMRVHLEEDPARIVYVGPSAAESKYVLVDYNRSGIPLCEIVTAPDLSSPREARKFLQELASILEYLDVFDSRLEGSLRCDANISLEGGERVEIKNIAGFKEVEEALTFEVLRQSRALEMGKQIERETRGYDQKTGVTFSLRGKEFEEEYGYIFEPDLPVIRLRKGYVERIRRSLPELPQQKFARFSKLVGPELAKSLVADRDLALAFERLSKQLEPKLVAVWLGNVLKKILNYHNLRFRDIAVSDDQLLRLLRAVKEGKVTKYAAEQVLRELVHDSTAIAKLFELERITDESELKRLVNRVLEANTKAVLDYKAGRIEALDYLVGAVMRESKGRADPKLVRKLLEELLGS